MTWATNQYGLGCDPSRFLLQAYWLSDGYGFRENTPSGRLCTSLPPGHPAILSLPLILTNDISYLRYLQATTPLLSGLIVFFTLRRYWKIRYLAALLLASSPWLTALSSCHMSETSSTLLLSTLVLMSSILLRRATNPSEPNKEDTANPYQRSNRTPLPRSALIFAYGTLAALTILTSPGLIFSVTALLVLSTYYLRRSPVLLACGAIGLIIPLSIWQTHCTYADGSPALKLLTPLDASMNDEKSWVRTWARTPKETSEGYRNFAWNINDNFTNIPDHAFLSNSEKNEIIESYREAINPSLSPEERAKKNEKRAAILTKATSNRQLNRPIEVYIWLPIQRGILSWLEQQPVSYHGHDSLTNVKRLIPTNYVAEIRELGFLRATLRASRGLYATFVVISHYATLLLIGYSLLTAFKLAPRTTILIFGSILIYTYLHGLDGPECRRNIPFLPLLFCLPAIVSPNPNSKKSSNT